MSSADDADDERESRLQTPVADWTDRRTQKFTVFVVLPHGDVCTLRELPSGITVFDVKGRLEIYAGIPCQIYTLIYPDGEELDEDQRLHIHENILHGYLLKMQLHDNWESLYTSVTRNNIEHVNHAGGVHLRGNISVSTMESDRYEAMVRERGAVALYMSAALGLQRMIGMLLSVGVNVNSITPFGRTPLHAAASKDHLVILDLLINNGANAKQPDYFGSSPMEVAKETSSPLCAKRLRLMVLNLRGDVFTSSPRPNIRKRPQINVTQRTKVDSYASRDMAPEVERAKSTISQCSEDSLFQHGSQSPIHKTRKPLSSSAPANNFSRALPKRSVRWKDMPRNSTYWNVRDIKSGSSTSLQSLDGKPMAIARQEKPLKFDSGTKKSDDVANDAEQGLTDEQREARAKIEDAARKTKSRLRYYKKLAENIDALKAMRRKINISANNGRSARDAKNSEAFNKWLEKKQEEFENMAEDDDSGESINNEEEEDDKMYDFNKRVRKQNRPKVRSMTPGNRPVKDIISIGSTMAGDSSNPPPYLNANAYWEWRRDRKGRKSTKIRYNYDVGEEMIRLEERRQRLLLSAISYEEWMDHNEDRKMLIQRILKADSAEMERLEKEKLKEKERRERMYSYDVWNEQVKKRNIDEKKRKEKLKRYEEQYGFRKLGMGQSSAAVQFETWLERKRLDMQREKEKMAASAKQNEKPRRSPVQVETAYDEWLQKKHNQDMAAIGTSMKQNNPTVILT